MEVVNRILSNSFSIHLVKNTSKISLKQYYSPDDEKDKTLNFESWFEYGNLNLLIKMPDNEYYLMLQNDINTNGLSELFFFRVLNTFKSQTIKYNILNLSKPDSHYNYGMNFLWLCQRRKSNEEGDWFWDGGIILYLKNCFINFQIHKSIFSTTKSSCWEEITCQDSITWKQQK